MKLFKKKTFSEAQKISISVKNIENVEIACLVPVGPWALNDDHLITLFSEWRGKFMRYFLTQFESSPDLTIKYLLNISLKQNNRILFAIYEDEELVGHIGLCNINETQSELDNFIRGKKTKNDDLIYFAEKALIYWAIDMIQIEKFYARCLSINVQALSLHARFGFTLKERQFIRMIERENSFSYEASDEAQSTEKFYLDIIETTKDRFYDSL